MDSVNLKQHQKGFTLVELMIAIVVLGILIAVAVPSFTKQIQRNQMRSAVADFITAVAYARAESVKRGDVVHVYSATADWSTGWCVTTNKDGCGDINTTLIRQFDGLGKLKLTGEDSTDLLSFNAEGYLENGNDVKHLSLCAVAGEEGKKIEVLPLGQTLVSKCPCNANKVCS